MENSAQTRFRDLLANNEFVLLDGAMGTELQRQGLLPGERPESWNLHQPQKLLVVHRAYLAAGSQIILSNTFGASFHKLGSTALAPEDVIPAGIALAKQAITESASQALAAFDCGPLGELMEPNGSLSFEAAYGDFAAQIRLAEAAGADLIVFETMSDLYELKAALLAAYENSHLPVIASMTFETNGRTFGGTDVASFATLATSLHAAALGINCSAGPAALAALARELLTLTPLPVMIKPNAGLPHPQSGLYDLSPDAFANEMLPLAGTGVKLLGGCCGTNNLYIAKLQGILEDEAYSRPPYIAKGRICSATRTLTFGDFPLIVGEKLNPTGKPDLQDALRNNDYAAYARQAAAQENAQADILDVNCGLPGIDEAAAMRSAVLAVQAVCRLPLQIDATRASVIEGALRIYNGKPIINSVSGKQSSLARILPLAKKYGAALLILPLDEAGIPASAAERLQVVRKVVAACDASGIPREDLIVDGLVLTASAEPSGPAVTLETLRLVKAELGLATTLGLSNVSFGLPARRRLNQVFYAQALEAGADMAILNPEHTELVETRYAHAALHGLDPDQRRYLQYFETTEQAGQETLPRTADERDGLRLAILQGLDAEAKSYTMELLRSIAPLQLIQEQLIPALDEVGDRFAKGITFLPQLLQSARAAQLAFDLVRLELRRSAAQGGSEAPDAPVIVLATVEGDIHDIGKNIARTILENYGYRVIDLGKDVAPSTVAQTVVREDCRLLGLSALMTSTLPAMEETIRLVKTQKPDCRIMAGGAVLNRAYALKIGADYYCPDASSGVLSAKEVFR